METIDMATLVQDALARFSRNRIGDKPPVSLTLSPAFTPVPWRDRGLQDFVRFFLYDALISGDPDAAIEISLRPRLVLNDLNAFLGIRSSYWVQLRVCGPGLKVVERFVEDLFADVGYRCEEWVGVEGSSAQLGIFGAIDAPSHKMVFCLEATHFQLTCDLLVPVTDESSMAAAVFKSVGGCRS